MKNIIKTTALTLLMTGVAGAQTLINERTTTKKEIFKLTDSEVVVVKTIDHQIHQLVFDPADEGKTNQKLTESPVYVDKKIYIDNNNDGVYDKEVQISYIKEEEEKNQLEYVPTEDGVLITTSNNTSKLINEEGMYEVEIEDLEDVTILVEDISELIID